MVVLHILRILGEFVLGLLELVQFLLALLVFVLPFLRLLLLVPGRLVELRLFGVNVPGGDELGFGLRHFLPQVLDFLEVLFELGFGEGLVQGSDFG